MNDFCVDALSPERALRPHHGVLRVTALAVTSDAGDAADLILRNAQDQADAILENAREQARQAVEFEQKETIARAAVFLSILQDAHATFLDHSQDIVIELAQGLFDRLVMDLTPRKRLEAALKRVVREAPPRLVFPVLRVHPDDVELVPAVDWDVKADASMSRGMCRLEASSGEWCADFASGMEALKSGLEQCKGMRIESAKRS